MFSEVLSLCAVSLPPAGSLFIVEIMVVSRPAGLYCDGFPQGIAVTSDNSVGARQPSNCTTVGDRFYGKC
jgi:hypothetical protein